ncbi:hypothetical protein TrCOL_g6993 [Triparma columacea]|uniref:TLC domain-containing protein n=1 Tax=Triparma columacea TaxID=722753 RepID=A0A9W7G5V7_9STRA|nr:hypothetical protein TrCOL_g6993 [Triparma columacea]
MDYLSHFYYFFSTHEETAPLPLSPSYSSLSTCFIPCAYWIGAMMASFALTTGILHLTTSLKGIPLQRIAGYISQYPFFIAMVYYAHAGTLDLLYEGAKERAFQSSKSGDTFCYIYIASNIVAALGQIQTESGALLIQLMIHHALSITCFSLGFAFDRFRFWTAFAGCCEMTNLFLVPLFLTKELPHLKQQAWYKFDCTLLWITFVSHRFVLFPCWLYLWIKDQDELQIKDMNPLESYLYAGTIAGLLILSLVWFVQIHRGTVNAWWPDTYVKKGKKE